MELNEKQYEAVTTTEGPLLLISGPGSGKTRTLVERAVYLLVEKKVKPENISMSRWRMLIPWMLKNYGNIFRIQKSIN